MVKLVLQKSIDFIINFNITKAGELTLKKFSTILSQYGVENTTDFDIMLEEFSLFFGQFFDIAKLGSSFLIKLNFLIWKFKDRRKEDSLRITSSKFFKKSNIDICLTFFSVEAILKNFLDKKLKSNNIKYNLPGSKMMLLKGNSYSKIYLKENNLLKQRMFCFAIISSRNLIFGKAPNFTLLRLVRFIDTFSAQIYSFKNRRFFKSRKINFRRKVKRLGLEQF